ncbi:RNA-dependent RNA polymerase, partial [Brno virus]
MQRYYQLADEIRELKPGTVSAPECLNLLDKLYETRHNLVDEMIKHDWSHNKDTETAIGIVLLQAGVPETLINKFEKLIIPNHPTGKTLKQFMKMTPDNYRIDGDTISFIEVTVTSDVDKGIREKKIKYEDGLNLLQHELDIAYKMNWINRLIKIKFDVVAIKTDGSNMSSQWPSQRNAGVVQHMRLVQTLILYVREHLINPIERSALEAMFNLKFHIGGKSVSDFQIPHYAEMDKVNPDIKELVDYCGNWMSKKTHVFSFQEVTGKAVQDSFTNFEEQFKLKYKLSRKARNFLLIQVCIQEEYRPSTIVSDNMDVKNAVYNLLLEQPITPTQHLVRDILYEFQALSNEDLASFYSNKSQFLLGLKMYMNQVHFKVRNSRLSTESKKALDILSNHEVKQTKEIESLDITSSQWLNHSCSIIEQILGSLEMKIGEGPIKDKVTVSRTYVDSVLKKFTNNELEKYLLSILRKTVCWNVGHCVRDLSEALIAHAGLRRSKYYSIHGFHNGSVLLVILPSKSLEVSNSYIRFLTVFKEGFGLYDPDNIDSKMNVDGVSWIFSKVMSLDLNRLLALNTAFEKSLIATAVWFQYYVEDQGHFPLQSTVRTVYSFHQLLAVCQKMKVCALFDNLRYLIPACTAQYSGYNTLIHKFIERPFKSAFEVFIYDQSRRLLIGLAQSNNLRYYSKVRLIGMSVDQSSIGASGVYSSLICKCIYRHYKSLISEVTTCFFIFEKGLHGTMSEEAKIHMETVEWMNNFKDKEQKYGKKLVENGYRISQIDNDELVQQQLYCQDVVELAANELNRILISKTQVIASSILNKHWSKPYFSQPRNISLKGMSGRLQEDGHLQASVTLIESIRYLTQHKYNPTILQIYDETKHIRPQARIVRKHQRTEADRGFFITTQETRVRLEIIEDYFDAIAKNVTEEYISYGGEKKILNIQNCLEKALRWASGKSFITLSTGEQIVFKRKLMYVSADATKWSPGDNSAKFKLFTANIHDGLKDSKLKNCVIDALKNIYETEFFISRRLRGYIDKMEQKEEKVKEFLDFFDYSKERSGLVRGNWLQGNLNKCSSLFSVAVSLLFKKVWSELFSELDCFIEVAHHSDDALFIYGYLEPEDDGSAWYEYVSQKNTSRFLYWHTVNGDIWKAMFNLHEHILLMGSIKISPKKTTLSATMQNFLSTFFEGCSVSIPFSKVLLGCLSDLPGLGFFDDLASGQSRCVKALDLGCSPQVAQFALLLTNNKIERLYGTAEGMINNPSKFLDINISHVPIPLGGLGSSSIMELATAGIGMSDKLNLKRALDLYRHKKRDEGSYILGLFKFLMNLSEDVFNHARLGEFTFTGKVQWKILEYEFFDYFSHSVIKSGQKHPTYDYIVPTDRDDLLVYLIRKLNEPSITAAMTIQSPIQLRFRMQAKQHMEVCKMNDNWVTFRHILAAAHEFASTYKPNEIDVDLFNTLAQCTFSKEFAWEDFLNTVDCEVLQSRRIHRPKVARTFTVRERDQSLQNTTNIVIAYRFATTANEIRDVMQYAHFPESLPSDLKILHDGVYRELGLDLEDKKIMKRIAPLLYKSGRSRIVIVQGNVEGTAEGICSFWLRDMSFIRNMKIIPHREVLKAVSIFNPREQSGDRLNLAALRVCIEMWRWLKYNDFNTLQEFQSLWFEDKTLLDWVSMFQRKGTPLIDPEIQCAGLMIYDLFKDMSLLQAQANRRAYSGKQYDAYCYQTYNEETHLYEGDLRVTFNFGMDCARLEIFWDKKDYVLETSITSKHVFKKIMMTEVSNELIKCGMRFKQNKVNHTNALVLFKTDAGFEWGKPNIQCIVYRNCFLKTSLRTHQVQKNVFNIVIVDNGFKAIAQHDIESPRFLLAHAYHTIRDIRYQAIDAIGPIYFKNLYLNPIISAGLIENFMKGLPAVIPPNAYSLILNKAKISVDLFMFNKLLEYINPNNVLDLSGLEMTKEGYSTITSMSSKSWAEEMELLDDDIEDEDDYVIDLDDLDFDQIDLAEDIQHFLQDESAYTDDLIITEEGKELKRIRGLTKITDPVKLIKSWVSKSLSIEKVINPVGVLLMTRYLSKHYDFNVGNVTSLDPYELTEFEAIVKGWGEALYDNYEEIEEEAKLYLKRENCLPEDVIPDSLFSFRQTQILMNKLFLKIDSSLFY